MNAVNTINTINKIKTRILHKSDYKFMTNHNLSIKLTDQVITYNSGSDWKIIPLIWGLSYPIIYDTYISNGIEHDVTLVLCPITLITVMLEGIYTFSEYNGMKMILQEKGTNNLLLIDSINKFVSNIQPTEPAESVESNERIEIAKKYEVKITTLRNALMISPNLLYMIVNKHFKIDTLIDLSYYSNSKDINNHTLNHYIHPKTLCYIIQKKKFGSNKEKIYIVLGKDASKNIVTGYDTRKSGIFDYIAINSEKLIRDDAYIFPILWYTAKLVYPKSKVLYIIN